MVLIALDRRALSRIARVRSCTCAQANLSEMAGFHEPSSRIFANCVSDGATVFLWGGSGGVISNKEVDWFQISSVTWRKIETGGQHPLPGLSDGASSHSGQYLYTYGGRTGPESTDLHGSLYALDTTSYNWKQLSMCTPESPLKKSGCGMVVHGQELVVFGGRCGQQTGPVQPGSKHHGEYCNEMHWFNLKTGECMWGVVEEHICSSKLFPVS